MKNIHLERVDHEAISRYVATCIVMTEVGL